MNFSNDNYYNSEFSLKNLTDKEYLILHVLLVITATLILFTLFYYLYELKTSLNEIKESNQVLSQEIKLIKLDLDQTMHKLLSDQTKSDSSLVSEEIPVRQDINVRSYAKQLLIRVEGYSNNTSLLVLVTSNFFI